MKERGHLNERKECDRIGEGRQGGCALTEPQITEPQLWVHRSVQPPLLPPAAGGIRVHLPRGQA